MQRDDERRAACAGRIRASWRVRASSAGFCTGVQVFLTGAGAASPICLNVVWLAALSALPVSAAAALVCRRALYTGNYGRSTRFYRLLHGLLCAAFLLNTLFAAASLVRLSEQSLLPQAQAALSAAVALTAVILCTLSGEKGVSRLCFALRIALPALLFVLCGVSLPLNLTGLFPLLGPGAAKTLAGCLCMPGSAFAALILLYPPKELTQQELDGAYLPGAWFFVWRVLLGAALGAALLLAVTLGSTYQSIAPDEWGKRLLIFSSGRPREGAAQMALTLLETAAFVLLAAHMLLAAARALGVLCPKLRGEKASLAVVSVCAGVGLGALIACGLDRVLPAAPGMLVPLLAALMYYGRKRCG